MRIPVEMLFVELEARGAATTEAFRSWLAEPSQAKCRAILRAAAAAPADLVYTIRPGAPYSLTRPGCIGFVRGYSREGDCLFVMVAPSLTEQHWVQGVPIRTESIPTNLQAHVDAKWLRPITRAEAEALEQPAENAPVEVPATGVRA